MNIVRGSAFALILVLTVFSHAQTSESNYNSSSGFNYFTRSSWGADESLRIYNGDRPEPILVRLSADFYTRFAQELKLQKIISYNNEGEKLTWPLQYPQEISKIIIHHTALDKDEESPMQIIRDMLYHHAIGRGWGDIGYNYIIDKEGNVYEGRYGGEGVVGGHAGPGNRGSIGIAVLGNYNENELSPPALRSLELLIAQKAQLHNIDPEGFSYFRGKRLPNIIGHNAIMATSCPGKNIINLLPQIRKNVGRMVTINENVTNSQEKEFAFEYIQDFDEIKIGPDSRLEYTLRLRNTGTQTWTRSTRLLRSNNAVVARGLSVYPYRLQQPSVAPGEIGTFRVIIYSKLSGGFYYQTFTPEFNGFHKSDQTINIPTIVESPIINYELVAIEIDKSSLTNQERTRALVTLKNTGNVQWRNFGQNRISLGTDNPRDRISSFTGSGRMGYLQEPIVAPGETGQFVFNLQASVEPGLYEEYFAPVVEGVTWLDGRGMKFTLKVS